MTEETKQTDEKTLRTRYAGIGLILGVAVGFTLGGPVGAGAGAGIGLVLGAAIGQRQARQDSGGEEPEA